MKKQLLVLLAVASVAIVICTSCGSAGTTQTGPTPLTVNCGSGSVTIGQTLTCTASDSATWSSSNSADASVNASGVVTGIAAGTVTITASPTKSNETAGSANVTVVMAAPTIQSFTATPATIVSGQSSTLAWTATGNPTYTLNGAAVTGDSSVVSPTATTTYTLVATNSGGTAQAQVTVTVTATQQPATITSTDPPWFACNDINLCATGNVVKIFGTNFSPSCTLDILPAPDPTLTSATYVSSTEIDLRIGYGQPTYQPGLITIQVCYQTPQASNVFTIGMKKADVNLLAVDQNTGDIIQSDGTDIPTIRRYKADGVTLVNTFTGDSCNMALDNQTQLLFSACYLQKAIFSGTENGNPVGGGNYDGYLLSIVAAGGYVCGPEPSPTNQSECFSSTDINFTSPLINENANADQCASAIVMSGSTLWLLTLNCGLNTVSGITVPDMTTQGTLTLSGITTATAGKNKKQLAALSSGVGILVDPDANQAIIFNIGSSMDVLAKVSLDGFALSVVANEATHTFDVTLCITPEAIPDGVDSITTTGGKTLLPSATSNVFSMGAVVSPDGNTLYVGDNAWDLNLLNIN